MRQSASNQNNMIFNWLAQPLAGQIWKKSINAGRVNTYIFFIKTKLTKIIL